MKDICEGRAEQVACEVTRSAGPSMRPDAARCKSTDSCSNLETLLPRLGTISEEQAWALCHMASMCVMESSPPVRHELTLNNVYIKPDGLIWVREYDDNGDCGGRDGDDTISSSGDSGSLDEEEVISSLGVVIYNALDYGLDENDERELSPGLQELIERLTGDENEEAVSSSICSPDDNDSMYTWPEGSMCALDLVKLCEFRADCGDRPALPESQRICQRMIYEGDLMSLFQQKSKTFINDLEFLETAPIDLIRTWKDVAREVLAGVPLKPSRRVRSYASVQADVLMQIRVGGLLKKLKHVEISRTPKVNLLLDIKSGVTLKSAAQRVLSEKVKSSTPLENLLTDITELQSCQLRSVPDSHKKYRDKPAPDTSTILYRALRRAESDQRQMDYGTTYTVDDRQHMRAPPGMRGRTSNRRKHTPVRRQMQFALESSWARKPSGGRLSAADCLSASCLNSLSDFKGFTNSCSSPVGLLRPDAAVSGNLFSLSAPLPAESNEGAPISETQSNSVQTSQSGSPELERSPPRTVALPSLQTPFGGPDTPPDATGSHGSFPKCGDMSVLPCSLSGALEAQLRAADGGVTCSGMTHSRSLRKRQSIAGGASPRIINRRASLRRGSRMQSASSITGAHPSSADKQAVDQLPASMSCDSITPSGSRRSSLRRKATLGQKYSSPVIVLRSSSSLDNSGDECFENVPSPPTTCPFRPAVSVTGASYDEDSESSGAAGLLCDDVEPECRSRSTFAEPEDNDLPGTPNPVQVHSSATPLLLTGGLSCTEIMKIRKIQTDLDLDLIEDEEMMTKLRGGKICFICKKKKFSFFSYSAARQCILCKRKVCQDCITKVVLLDVDFTNCNIASDLENQAPIEACDGCRLSLLIISQKDRSRS